MGLESKRRKVPVAVANFQTQNVDKCENIGTYLEVSQHTCTDFSMSSTAWLHALLRHSQTRIVAAAASVTALVSTCSAVTPQTVWLEGGEDSGSSGSTTVSLGHRQRYASKQVAQLLSKPTSVKLKAHQAYNPWWLCLSSVPWTRCHYSTCRVCYEAPQVDCWRRLQAAGHCRL